MKAYLSFEGKYRNVRLTSDNLPGQVSRYKTIHERCVDQGIRAEIEAKRILADVEPLSEGYHFHIKSQSPWLPITDEDELLAEALENFVETLDKMGH